MNRLTSPLFRIGVLGNDLDYHLICASMVIIFAFFGYQKWFQYEAQGLIPYTAHGLLITLLAPYHRDLNICPSAIRKQFKEFRYYVTTTGLEAALRFRRRSTGK